MSGEHSDTTADEGWLSVARRVVEPHLPDPPARILEIGCGSLGGFVPSLLAAGYEAVGIDPEAPDGAAYHRIEFERADLGAPVDAIVASTSLHHVVDPTDVIDRIGASLVPGGAVVVIEWAWERFDERTAQWCFARLPAGGGGWLRRHRDEWPASGRAWPEYLRGWAEGHGLHTSDLLVRLLDERLERRALASGPYLFPELPDTSDPDEQAAIDRGEIEAMRVDWVGAAR